MVTFACILNIRKEYTACSSLNTLQKFMISAKVSFSATTNVHAEN